MAAPVHISRTMTIGPFTFEASTRTDLANTHVSACDIRVSNPGYATLVTWCPSADLTRLAAMLQDVAFRRVTALSTVTAIHIGDTVEQPNAY